MFYCDVATENGGIDWLSFASHYIDHRIVFVTDNVAEYIEGQKPATQHHEGDRYTHSYYHMGDVVSLRGSLGRSSRRHCRVRRTSNERGRAWIGEQGVERNA